MANYRLSLAAKEDLIRIHHYGIRRFGVVKADQYIDTFFEYFEMIAEQPFSFEAVDTIKEGYRRCVCGVDSIYYKISNDSLDIMEIVGKQNLNNVL